MMAFGLLLLLAWLLIFVVLAVVTGRWTGLWWPLPVGVAAWCGLVVNAFMSARLVPAVLFGVAITGAALACRRELRQRARSWKGDVRS